MATIIEGGRWTLTDEAADLLAMQNVIVRCLGEHSDVLDCDYPIYHLSLDRPWNVGFTTINGYIREAEAEVEKANG
jgi:hypothetical protein